MPPSPFCVTDLHDLGIRVELFGFNQPSHPFNYDTFYKHTIEHTNPDDGEEVDGNNTSSTTSLDPESRPAFCALSKFKEFKAIIHKKEFKKRSMFAIKFHLHNGLEIGVKGYNLYMEQKKAPFTHVHRESNRQVEPKSSFLCSDTTQILLPTDLKYFYSYGGEKIVFTKEELADIKTFGEPGKYYNFVVNVIHSYSSLPFTPLILKKRSTSLGLQAEICSCHV